MNDEPFSFRRNILLPLALNVVAGTIVFLFTSSIVYFILILAVGTVALFLLIQLGEHLYKQRLRAVSIESLHPYTDRHSGTEAVPISSRLRPLESRFTFMGVSGKSLWDSDIIKLIGDHSYANCEFRFLLMDPTGSGLRRRVEREPETTLSGAALDIDAFISQLREIKQYAPFAQIEVRLFDFVPPFWLMQRDDTVYVQTFPKGAIGRRSPLMVVKKTPGVRGFHEAFELFLDECWNHLSRSVTL